MVTQNSINNIVPNNDFTVQRTTNNLTVTEVRNTSGLNDALVSCVATSPGAGFYSSGQFGGANFWNFGMDPGSGTPMKISHSAGQGDPSTGTVTWNMTTAGQRTMPLQPSFYARLTASTAGVTGAGATYTFGAGGALTVIQQGSSMSTSGVFTVPVTGFYLLSCSIIIDNLVAANKCDSAFVLNGVTNIWYGSSFNIQPVLNGSGTYVLTYTGYQNLTAGDLITCVVQVSGEAGNTVTIRGGAVGNTSAFSGVLIC